MDQLNQMNAWQKRKVRYLEMSTDALSDLSDRELFRAVLLRTEHKVNAFQNFTDGINSLNNYQRIFYAVSSLYVEVNNGGLCQFFVNPSRNVAPLVSQYMGMIGAVEHQKLYEDFIKKYQIDLQDLSSFNILSIKAFSYQYERYPFHEYDDVFYTLKPLDAYLTEFVRTNIKHF